MIAILGTGIMGLPMARNLRAAGLEVRAWNRTSSRPWPTVALAESLAIDPKQFLETIEGGPLGVPYAALKGEAMVKRELPPSFPLELALKDAGLVLEGRGEEGPGAAGHARGRVTDAAGSRGRPRRRGHGGHPLGERERSRLTRRNRRTHNTASSAARKRSFWRRVP